MRGIILEIIRENPGYNHCEILEKVPPDCSAAQLERIILGLLMDGSIKETNGGFE